MGPTRQPPNAARFSTQAGLRLFQTPHAGSPSAARPGLCIIHWHLYNPASKRRCVEAAVMPDGQAQAVFPRRVWGRYRERARTPASKVGLDTET